MPDTFRVLYFATASQHTKRSDELFPAPMTLAQLLDELETRYKGITQKVLRRCMITVNLEYVDCETEEQREGVVLRGGDEVGILPPVSAG